nr:MAG TPA: hypothetical protein [Caudoviricetes sp.]
MVCRQQLNRITTATQKYYRNILLDIEHSYNK